MLKVWQCKIKASGVKKYDSQQWFVLVDQNSGCLSLEIKGNWKGFGQGYSLDCFGLDGKWLYLGYLFK